MNKNNTTQKEAAREELMQALADFRNGHATAADVKKARRAYNALRDPIEFDKALEASRKMVR